MATAWWVVVPPAEQNAGSVPADAKIISTTVGSADYNTLLNTDSGTITVGGAKYVRYMGPFNSKADAQKAKPGPLALLPGGLLTVQPGGQDTGALASPFQGLEAVGAFFTRLADPHTWLRVAEAIIGLAALVIGLNHLLGNPAAKVAGATPAGRIAKLAAA